MAAVNRGNVTPSPAPAPQLPVGRASRPRVERGKQVTATISQVLVVRQTDPNWNQGFDGS